MKRITGLSGVVLLGCFSLVSAGEAEDAKARKMEAYVKEHGALPANLPQRVMPLEQSTKAAAAPELLGGITYDTGSVSGTGGVASQMLGNRFDSALNTAGTMCCFPVESTGSVTMATFSMVNTFFSSAVVSIYSNIMGTSAVQVTSMAFPGLMTGLNTINIGTSTDGNYANGSFLAGVWQFDPSMTAVGLDTGTTGGQGFHAISLNDGAAGSMLATVSSLNAIFRVQGNVPTPVELLNFTIDE